VFAVEHDTEIQAKHSRILRHTAGQNITRKALIESSQWRRRGDARRQTVPYMRSCDRKCTITKWEWYDWL